MREVQARWADIKVDTYIKDRAGTVWRICAEDRGYFRAKNRQGDFTTLSPKPADTPVTMLETTEADAIPLLRDQLGARPIAYREHGEDKVWSCPPWPEQTRKSLVDFRDHMETMHGVYVGDVKDYAGLLAAHTRAHDPDSGRFGELVKHTHGEA